MGNNNGLIYGFVTTTSGLPISNASVWVNWVQRAEGGLLKIGGDDDLKTIPKNCKTTPKGAYMIPFYWASEQRPGVIASAGASRAFSDGTDDYDNKQGPLREGPDWRKLGATLNPLSDFSTFVQTVDKEDLGRMLGPMGWISTAYLTTEITCVYSRIDFSLSGGGLGACVPVFGLGEEADWRWCTQCQGLFYNARGYVGCCGNGALHSPDFGKNYRLSRNCGPGELGWKWCRNCQGLFWPKDGGGGCAKGGNHDQNNAAEYVLQSGPGDSPREPGWRYCKLCKLLYWAGNNPGKPAGLCPAASGGGHQTQSNRNYYLKYD
jgi:hypothetical protein